ncbi:unnamed protein product [Rhizopus stolonifer]
MKEGIQFVKIEPLTDRLEFIGPITKTTSGNHLKGTLSISLSRAVKVKSIALKFKRRYSTNRTNDLQSLAMAANALPKLKTKIVERSLALNGGQHSFPWEMVVPNVYPQTIATERCSISYYLELKISLGVGRSFMVEHPMTIQRHLVASTQSAVLLNTRIHKYTSPGKLYCEIEVPKLVCAGQGYFPIFIKYACVHETRIKHISTHIIQLETCRARSPAKTETEKRFGEQSVSSKITTDLYPITTSHVETLSSNIDISPLLLTQSIPETIIFGIDSPLVTIVHQLDVTFDLFHSKLQTRIPILMTTVPSSDDIKRISYPAESQIHQKPLSVETSEAKRPILQTPSLRKCLSDQQVGPLDTSLSPSSSTKTAGSAKFLAIDTNLANKLRSMSVDETDEKKFQMYYMNSPSMTGGILSPPMEANAGLFPPPRPRKKTLSSEHPRRHYQTRETMKKIPEALPTPPTSGRLSEFSPMVSPVDGTISHKRSDSFNNDHRKYPQSITSHYVSAELPPLPPPRSLIPTSEIT